MWRALFIALGISSCILGVECLAIEKAVLNSKSTDKNGMITTTRTNEVVPPEWAPWSLISAGAITVIYSFTLPQRVKGH
jgi:hypothetical protein